MAKAVQIVIFFIYLFNSGAEKSGKGTFCVKPSDDFVMLGVFFLVSMVKIRIRTELVLIARQKDVCGFLWRNTNIQYWLRMHNTEMKNQIVLLSEGIK